MFHPIYGFKLPTNDAAPIWRYMSFAKLCSLLQRKELYFCSPAVLAQDDPYEGQPAYISIASVSNDINNRTDAEIQQLTKSSFKSSHVLMKYLASRGMTFQSYLRERTDAFMRANFVNCWHMNDSESQAMWKIYAGDGTGVAIQSTVAALKRAFHCEVVIGQVEYIDYKEHAASQPSGLNECAYMYKRKEFSFEQELRALVAGDRYLIVQHYNEDGSEGTPGAHEYYLVKPRDPSLAGVFVPIDLNKLVVRLVIAPMAPEWFVDVVKSITTTLAYSFPVCRSEVARVPPLLEGNCT
jgi:hypothetical protein